MKIEALTPPEVVSADGMTVTLTHKCTSLHIHPADKVAPVAITVSKGWLRSEDGSFQDWGPHENATMDPQGYADFLAKAGDFKFSDLRPAIDKRKDDLAKAATAAEAKAKAIADQATAKAQADSKAMADKTTVSPNAKPAGPDAVAT